MSGYRVGSLMFSREPYNGRAWHGFKVINDHSEWLITVAVPDVAAEYARAWVKARRVTKASTFELAPVRAWLSALAAQKGLDLASLDWDAPLDS